MDVPSDSVSAKQRAVARHLRSRGFSILFAVSLIASLSVGAAWLLIRAGNLGRFGGAQNRSTKILAAANDGARWGLDQVNAMTFPNNQATMDLNALLALRPLTARDPLCPNNAPCDQFRLLSANQGVGAEGGTARVAVACNPNGCSTPPSQIVNFQIRSLGQLPSGESRLVEMIVAPLQP